MQKLVGDLEKAVKKFTPRDFIKIETKHYRETHLPQLQKLLKNNHASFN